MEQIETHSMGRPSPPRSSAVTVLLCMLAVAMLALAPIGPIFFPYVQAPERVDAIMVLGPPDKSRLALAEELMAEGLSSNLVISVTDQEWHYSPSNIPLCTQEQDFNVYCRKSEPFTTQGEIGKLQALADKFGWQSVAVITFTPHISRTRLYLDRCFDGNAIVLNGGTPLTERDEIYQYFYQVGGFAKAVTLTSDCV